MIPRSIFNAVFTGWIQADQNAWILLKANSSSKHRTTYNAVVISGASKWVEEGEKNIAGWDLAPSNYGNR